MPSPLTHRCVLVDQQVGVKEVIDEVWQAIALTWEEEKTGSYVPGVGQQGWERLRNAHRAPGSCWQGASPKMRASRRQKCREVPAKSWQGRRFPPPASLDFQKAEGRGKADGTGTRSINYWFSPRLIPLLLPCQAPQQSPVLLPRASFPL